MKPDPTAAAARPPSVRRRRYWLLVSLAVVGVAAVVFRKPLQDAVVLRSLLMTDAPAEAAFQELAGQSNDPFRLVRAFWDTQKLPHRLLAASYLKDNALGHPRLSQQAESLLVSAAFDVDASVRELAFATMALQKDAELPRLAIALLRDVDPQMRLLALQYLRGQKPAAVLPAVVRALDDPDPSVVTSADSALRVWTRQDFGVRISQAVPGSLGPGPTPAQLQLIQDGVRHWKDWWSAHQGEYAEDRGSPLAAPTAPQRLPAADFALKDLTGKTSRLSDFKGKVVLLNFWTTWCPGCLAEIPDLIELQKRNPERLVILGISLDGQSEVDEHGDSVGAHSPDEPARDHAGAREQVDLAELRAKVGRFVQEKGMNYRVLLDPASDVGRRFNGGELPTTALIDTEGFVRRRFIGGRSLAVSEAMIRELEHK